MQRGITIAVCAVLGFFVGASMASAIVGHMYSYAHNMALEGAVYAMFIGGPIGALIVGFAVAWFVKPEKP